MQVDFLIVGQGLAGSLLAWTLMQRGCRVLVLDNNCRNASQVAAGIVNPVSGKRLAKSEAVETVLPAALACYGQLSDFFGKSFYVRKKMLRLFQSEAERIQAVKRQENRNYEAYLGYLADSQRNLDGFSTPFGYIEQKLCGHLSTGALLAQLKDYFIAHDAYRQTIVDYEDLQFSPKVKWSGLSTKQVVFCEGYLVVHNPWFKYLPFQPVKGEILTLNQPTPLPETIINYGNWLLPSTSGTFRVGATFDRDNIDTAPTVEGKQTLLDALGTFNTTLAHSAIEKHEAGIRPCTADRYPIIGSHPQYNKLAVFNGFGAKGSMQIPWFCERFADHLLLNAPLPANCDIKRFNTSHFPG